MRKATQRIRNLRSIDNTHTHNNGEEQRNVSLSQEIPNPLEYRYTNSMESRYTKQSQRIEVDRRGPRRVGKLELYNMQE
jgi:hypothetical protein